MVVQLRFARSLIITSLLSPPNLHRYDCRFVMSLLAYALVPWALRHQDMSIGSIVRPIGCSCPDAIQYQMTGDEPVP